MVSIYMICFQDRYNKRLFFHHNFLYRKLIINLSSAATVIGIASLTNLDVLAGEVKASVNILAYETPPNVTQSIATEPDVELALASYTNPSPITEKDPGVELSALPTL